MYDISAGACPGAVVLSHATLPYFQAVRCQRVKALG